ncbi:uncharacterized protein LOC108914005 [Anoplophora glabripennis]|uniref:uncharacterized protein LOC108914005 n=1 Tax=Anoplophora glabripennis TaxID=217634 RepID=UPI000874BD0D|nr:uncharacterized protein LOC108914005 [Anoplophora glabripennis]
MQRILSVEASRNTNNSISEYVTKRLCCSVVLTVTFFGFLGGFLLGKFIAERSNMQLQTDFQELSRKVSMLNNNLQKTFPLGFNETLSQCSQYIFFKCNFLQIGKNDTGQLLAADYLKTLNSCFGNS